MRVWSSVSRPGGSFPAVAAVGRFRDRCRAGRTAEPRAPSRGAEGAEPRSRGRRAVGREPTPHPRSDTLTNGQYWFYETSSKDIVLQSSLQRQWPNSDGGWAPKVEYKSTNKFNTGSIHVVKYMCFFSVFLGTESA